MQGITYVVPATLKVTGSNTNPDKIKKYGIPSLKKTTSSKNKYEKPHLFICRPFLRHSGKLTSLPGLARPSMFN
jgi:hypothetical protein